MKTETTLSGITLAESLLHSFEHDFLPFLRQEASFLQKIRKEAATCFQKSGFPHQKMEEWRHTSLKKTLSVSYQYNHQLPLEKEDVSQIFKCDIHHMDTQILTLLNGWYTNENEELTILSNGAIYGSLKKALERFPELIEPYYSKLAVYQDNGLNALNTAFARDGIFIYVPDEAEIDKTIQIVNIINTVENVIIQPRNLVILGKNTKLQLVHCDHSVHHKASFVNSVSEIFIGENSSMDHYKLQNKDNESTQVTSTYFHQSANSRLTSNVITLNGGIVRNNLIVTLGGQGCDVQLNGLYLVDKEQHVDNFVYVDHQYPDCTSNQLYKGILDDQATAVFNGHINVRKDSQRTIAYQNNKNILLTDKATVYTQPQLEIYADDVKCSHGATVGQLDPESLFYMRSRGIREDTSRMLLMYAFAADVINHIRIEPVRHQIDEMVYKRLRGELSICDQCILDCNATRAPVFEIDISKI